MASPPRCGAGVPVLREAPQRFRARCIASSISAIARAAFAAQVGIAGAMRDGHRRQQPGAEPRPAVVALDLDPHRHALDHAGELSGDDVTRHQGELGAGRLVDPDDPALEWLRERVELDADRVARLDAGQAILLQIGLDEEQVRVVHAQQRGARRGEVAKVAVSLDDHAGERGPDLGIRQVILGGLQPATGLLDRLFLDLDQELELVDLVVSSLREVNALGRLLLGLLCRLQRPPGDVDLCQGGSRFGELRLGQLDLGLGGVARLRHMLLALQSAGPRLLEPGEACVLQLGQRQRGPRRLETGTGLVDALLHVVAGQLQRFLSLGTVGLGGGERPPGDLDLDRNLLADAVQVRTLAGQLGQSRVELGPGDD